MMHGLLDIGLLSFIREDLVQFLLVSIAELGDIELLVHCDFSDDGIR